MTAVRLVLNCRAACLQGLPSPAEVEVTSLQSFTHAIDFKKNYNIIT